MNSKKEALRLPVVSLGAEYMAMAYLLRRNILTYKAPPNNEGYDLICIHPDTKKQSKALRIQVKSRYQSDSDRGFLVKDKSFDSFDYLIVVFLNIGFYFKNKPVKEGMREPEIYVLPNTFIRDHHKITKSGWQRVLTKNLDIDQYKNDLGIEMIARELKISYPEKEQ